VELFRPLDGREFVGEFAVAMFARILSLVLLLAVASLSQFAVYTAPVSAEVGCCADVDEQDGACSHCPSAPMDGQRCCCAVAFVFDLMPEGSLFVSVAPVRYPSLSDSFAARESAPELPPPRSV